MNKVKIDDLDKKILSMLVKNARIPFLEIARECNISGAAVHQRVQKLEESGVLKGSQFILDESVLGYNSCAFIGIFLEKANMYSSVVEKLKLIPEVVGCYYTTGNYAIFIKIYTENNKCLMDLLSNSIQSIEGVSRTETFISLEQAIDRQVEVR